MIFDVISFAGGAVAAVVSTTVYKFVAKQVASAKADSAAELAKVETEVKKAL